MQVLQQIWNGDSIELGTRFHRKKNIQCVITDPPFGVDNQSKSAVNPDSKKLARKIANDESPEIAMAVFSKVMNVIIPGMKDESDIYVFTSYQVLEQWLPFTRKLFAPHGFDRKAILLWEKDGPGQGDLDTWGMGCEFILYFKRGRRPNTGKRRSTVLGFSQIHPSRLIHPHEKPEPLLEELLIQSTDEEDLVVDPFGGSGSLARAARNLNRSAVCIELDEFNAQEAIKKLEGTKGLF